MGSGDTGHGEAVQITYDPQRITYGRLLQIYFSIAHDPTRPDRQGPDRGTQYRSAIFPVTRQQGQIAKGHIAQLDQARAYGAAIATRIEPGKTFYPAEACHQDFLARNPDHPHIVIHDLPRIAELRRLFPDAYRPGPVLVSAVAAAKSPGRRPAAGQNGGRPSPRFDMTPDEPRIGIDLGGTKIEGIVMQAGSRISHRLRVPTPRDDYAGQIRAVAGLVAQLERDCARSGLRVGIGHPGAISPGTGLIKNANSVCLNGRPLKSDLERALGRPVRMANDADCLAASEQSDGAAAGASCVFAVILGTGVGGGIAIDGRLLSGPNAIAGEWGHNPLPWPRPDWNEVPGPLHWDGRHGPIEAWLSGPGLAADHARVTGVALAGEAIVEGARRGDPGCCATLDRYEDRLARALATVINLIDPQVIVLGGGLSRIERLYGNVPRLWSSWVFSDHVDTRLVPALHGDSSGVRGAARLWPEGAA